MIVRGLARKKDTPAATSASPVAYKVKVVLRQSIPALGSKGSVVDANAGWMRHELFPKGKAVYATPENIKVYSMSAEERSKLQDPKEREQKRLVKLINSLTTMNVNIGRRSDWFRKQPDQMLGSVTAWDITQAVERQYGVRLDASHLFMDGPITAFGMFKIPLNLRTKEDRQVELTVSVNSLRWINHGHSYV